MSALVLNIWAARWGKYFLFVWVFSLAGVVALTVLSALEGEALGGFVFGLLVGAIFLNASIILSYRAGQSALVIGKVTWICFSLVALCLAVILHGDASDADAPLIYIMIALSFPAGLLVMVAGQLLSGIPAMMQLVILWLLCFGLGFLQWFVVLPRLIGARKVSGLRSPSSYTSKKDTGSDTVE